MARKTLTYGTLPTREEFDAAFDALMGRCVRCRRKVENCACRDTEISSRFAFGNDPRVGNAELTASELWTELVEAQREWAGGCNGVECDGDRTVCVSECAGQWCSDVLGVLGFEWV